MPTEQKVVLKTNYNKIRPYTTKDGAIIRELMHPDVHGNSNQSLAEATITQGTATALHRHKRSEEIYHFAFAIGAGWVGVAGGARDACGIIRAGEGLEKPSVRSFQCACTEAGFLPRVCHHHRVCPAGDGI